MSNALQTKLIADLFRYEFIIRYLRTIKSQLSTILVVNKDNRRKTGKKLLGVAERQNPDLGMRNTRC